MDFWGRDHPFSKTKQSGGKDSLMPLLSSRKKAIPSILLMIVSLNPQLILLHPVFFHHQEWRCPFVLHIHLILFSTKACSRQKCLRVCLKLVSFLYGACIILLLKERMGRRGILPLILSEGEVYCRTKVRKEENKRRKRRKREDKRRMIRA